MTADGLARYDFFVQVLPGWIPGFNQSDFHLSTTSLDLLLAQNSALHGGVWFVPYQQLASILFTETFNQTFLMLPDTLSEVGGYPRVKRSIALVGQNVNTGMLHGSARLAYLLPEATGW